jgi:hypothetical protein
VQYHVGGPFFELVTEPSASAGQYRYPVVVAPGDFVRLFYAKIWPPVHPEKVFYSLTGKAPLAMGRESHFLVV